MSMHYGAERPLFQAPRNEGIVKRRMGITLAELREARKMANRALTILRAHPELLAKEFELPAYEAIQNLDKAVGWVDDLRLCVQYNDEDVVTELGYLEGDEQVIAA